MIESNVARLMADVGFMAISRGFDTEALVIFDGLTAARPTQEAGPLGRALVHLLRDEIDEAARLLRALPPSDAALSFLALAKSRSGDKAAARELLENVKRSAGDPVYASLADDLLGALKS
jgi:hypothetical protein